MRDLYTAHSAHTHLKGAYSKPLIAALLLALLACGNGQGKGDARFDRDHTAHQTEIAELNFKVLAAYPHDPNAFTQGLVLHEGQLYESRGLYGRSSVARLDLTKAEAVQYAKLGDEFFGEGLAIAGNELVQLTWKSGKVFRYNINSLELSRTQSISGVGWGLANYRDQLVSTDGSATLYFRDADTLAIERELKVTLLGREIRKLNELEAVDGTIAANILQSATIVFIDPGDGKVVARINLENLLKREQSLGKVDVLNGIAYKSDSGTLLVTGKLWRHIYEIQLIDPLPSLQSP